MSYICKSLEGNIRFTQLAGLHVLLNIKFYTVFVYLEELCVRKYRGNDVFISFVLTSIACKYNTCINYEFSK